MYTRKKEKLYIHLYKYTAKLDSIWRHKYTDNLQYCFTKQKLINDLTVIKVCNTIYSSSFFYKVLYTQTDTNKNKHFTTSSYNFFAIWYTCKSFPFFFVQCFTFSFSHISFTIYVQQLHILFLNTPFIGDLVKQRNGHFLAGPHRLVAVPRILL